MRSRWLVYCLNTLILITLIQQPEPPGSEAGESRVRNRGREIWPEQQWNRRRKAKNSRRNLSALSTINPRWTAPGWRVRASAVTNWRLVAWAMAQPEKAPGCRRGFGGNADRRISGFPSPSSRPLGTHLTLWMETANISETSLRQCVSTWYHHPETWSTRMKTTMNWRTTAKIAPMTSETSVNLYRLHSAAT
jgi:hypothetical protein